MPKKTEAIQNTPYPTGYFLAWIHFGIFQVVVGYSHQILTKILRCLYSRQIMADILRCLAFLNQVSDFVCQSVCALLGGSQDRPGPKSKQ